MDIEERVRTMLLPVFGLSAIGQIRPEAALVKDLGAESLDFVQIIYLVEREFGVIIKPEEILSGAMDASQESLFTDGILTGEGAALLNAKFPGHGVPFAAGLTKRDIYFGITVRDLAAAIGMRLRKAPQHA